MKITHSVNILMIVRSNCYTSPGGDTVQIDLTAKYLRELGAAVTIASTHEQPDYYQFDLIHFFNIIRPDDILPHIQHSVPYMVSTVFVDYSEYEAKNKTGIIGNAFKILESGQIEYLKAFARWIVNGERIKSFRYIRNGHKKSIRYIARTAKMLLPNSDSEYQRLAQYMEEDFPYRKIVNAIDSRVFKYNVAESKKHKDHILCVGRIEGRKNQLNLIKALIDSPYQLTIIGKPSPNHLNYYKACKALAATATNIHFIEHIAHEELVSIYKAAKVHVLPSWFETTGLSTLEAAAMDCNIVVTKKGDTEEYFQDFAYYCDPDDVASIRKAVDDAHSKPVNPKLSKFILENYNWNITAEQTLNAYMEVLNYSPKEVADQIL